MNKNTRGELRRALALAACTLLTSGLAKAQQTQSTFDAATLYYREQGRVSVFEPSVSLRTKTGEGDEWTLRAAMDSVSGASPTGAAPMPVQQTQTTTGASGGTTATTTAANEQPRAAFTDTRLAAGIDWLSQVAPERMRTLGLNASTEKDYQSLSGNAAYQFDFNNKNTQFITAASFSADTVSPTGGAPQPLQWVANSSSTGNSKSKNIAEGLLGINQVLGRRAILQINASINSASGYLNDPYKVLSVVNADGLLVGDNGYRFEKRPDSRTAQIFFARLALHAGIGVAHFDARYFSDDWGIRAHNFHVLWHHFFGDFYLEPEYRYYHQSRADFFRYFLKQDEALPTYASADPRLAAFTGTTMGLGLGWQWNAGAAGAEKARLSFRYARLTQTGDSSPAEAFGVLRSQNLYPDLIADIFSLSLHLPL